MRAEHINPFIIATQEIFRSEMNAETQRSSLSLQKKPITSEDITIIISLTGEVEGVVVFGLSNKTADNFITAVLNEPADSLEQKIKISAMAEMGNIISGRASALLSEGGFICDITPPTVIMGRKVKISTLNIQRIRIDFETDLGPFEISVSLHQKARK